jgi:hypothetical protein
VIGGTNVPQWTTITPDDRRVVVIHQGDTWTVACGQGEETTRRRLDVALIEAILMDDDFALHSLRFDYAAWVVELVEQIERGERSPDAADPA